MTYAGERMYDAFDVACKEKFARGVAEHGPGWPNVDAPKEIMEECCDIANYATLLKDPYLAAWATEFARVVWQRCWVISQMSAQASCGPELTPCR